MWLNSCRLGECEWYIPCPWRFCLCPQGAAILHLHSQLAHSGGCCKSPGYPGEPPAKIYARRLLRGAWPRQQYTVGEDDYQSKLEEAVITCRKNLKDFAFRQGLCNLRVMCPWTQVRRLESGIWSDPVHLNSVGFDAIAFQLITTSEQTVGMEPGGDKRRGASVAESSGSEWRGIRGQGSIGGGNGPSGHRSGGGSRGGRWHHGGGSGGGSGYHSGYQGGRGGGRWRGERRRF